MGAPGRPTPQPTTPDGDRPRFKDRDPEDYRDVDVNPFVTSHLSFGPELVPAAEAWRWRDRWAERFDREAPLHVEIGSGNGFFLSGLGARRPDWNVLGIELRFKRTVICAKKIREAGLTHTIIARYHAAYLDDLFEADTLSGLYVNHPDPWPKREHDKNRVVSRWFLEDAARLLKVGSKLQIKSDFPDNIGRVERLLDHGRRSPAPDTGFAWDPRLVPLPRLPFEITGRSSDVARDGAPWPDDILTNYQRKMNERGVPVHAIELVRTCA